MSRDEGAFPDQAAASFERGNQLRKAGHQQEAIEAYDEALRFRADYPEALNNRGNALRDLQRFEEALSSYDLALELNPAHERALNNRGNVLRDLKRYEEALASYNLALSLGPLSAAALNNRGLVLLDMEHHQEALNACERVVLVDPKNAEAHYNRGNVLLKMKRHEEALVAYTRAVELAPDHVNAWNNRGNVLLFLRRAPQAVASYNRAFALKLGDAEILNNQGHAYEALGNNVQAAANYARAIAAKPDYAEALFAYAQVLRDLKRNEEAIAALEKLLAVDPDYGRGTLAEMKRGACVWKNFEEESCALINEVREGKNASAPFAFLAVSDSPKDQFLCSKTFLGESVPFEREPIWKGERYGHDKIRVAYLSADFREHPGAYLMAGLFEAHDRSRFDITAVSWGRPAETPIRTRIVKAFDRFLDVDLVGDREVAQKLRELEIDIVVNRMGYTRYARTGIVAVRPAPVQVSFLGYPGTTAADYVDYLIADKIVIPDDEQKYYSEKIVTLPDSYQCNDSKRAISENTPSRADAGLPETGFVFCGFNNVYKITPAIFDVWMRLLKAVDGSVLWLTDSNPLAARNLRSEAEARGVAGERLVFARYLKLADHLARHRLADLWLDTLPYNGHTTASDALWAGVPVLTCTGTTFAGRVATSVLHAIGMEEMATRTLEDYEALALKLARDRDALSAIRAKLARNRDTYPLFDTARFCRHLERAYTTMWERAERGEPPRAFRVNSL